MVNRAMSMTKPTKGHAGDERFPLAPEPQGQTRRNLMKQYQKWREIIFPVISC